MCYLRPVCSDRARQANNIVEEDASHTDDGNYGDANDDESAGEDKDKIL